ncbi:MAG: hypothetical protein HPY71_14265 [Firmicutes bacterium]|nr:hypothetical protein [Bacillota bacterium]
MNELQEFEKTVAVLEQVVRGDTIYETFRGGEVERLDKAICVMRDRIRQVMTSGNEEVPGGPERTESKSGDTGKDNGAPEGSREIDLVAGTFQIIEHAFLVRQVPEAVMDFIDKYILLAFNWNKLACSDKIAEGVQAVLNLKSYHQSVVETTRVLRYLIREARSILEFKPPIFDLSKHYLQAIQEKIKESITES